MEEWERTYHPCMHLPLDVLTAAGLLLLFAGAQRAYDRGMSPETTRTAVHVAGASAAACFPLYLALPDVILLAGAFTAFLTWTYARGFMRSVHGVHRVTLGALVFPVGLGTAAAVAWAHPASFSYAALILGLADPAASYAGRSSRSPSWRVPGSTKSLAGSLAFFAVALALGVLFTLHLNSGPTPAVVLVAATLAVTEALLGYGLDNLPLPILAAALGQHAIGL